MSTGLGNVDICGVYITELFIILAKYSIIMQRETSSPSTQSSTQFILCYYQETMWGRKFTACVSIFMFSEQEITMPSE